MVVTFKDLQNVKKHNNFYKKKRMWSIFWSLLVTQLFRCAWNDQNPESWGVWKMLSLIWQSHLWFRKIVVRRSAHFACMELEVNHWQEEVHCQKSRWRTQSMNNGSHQNEAQTRNKRSFRSAKFSLKDIHCHVTGSIHLSQIHIHFFSKRNWLDGV